MSKIFKVSGYNEAGEPEVEVFMINFQFDPYVYERFLHE